jgi:hypothetical protein
MGGEPVCLSGKVEQSGLSNEVSSHFGEHPVVGRCEALQVLARSTSPAQNKQTCWCSRLHFAQQKH